MMHDHHVHIGQFNEIYYDYHSVFLALQNNGVDEITLAYLTPSFSKMETAVEFYNALVSEFREVKDFAKKIGMKIHFLYWADPLVLESGIGLKHIFEDFQYFGIALHPLIHQWTKNYCDLLDGIFQFAVNSRIPLYIHTGISVADEPLQFLPWFEKFPQVEIHLAHCKDPVPIIDLFSRFPNMFGDTAFCPEDSYAKIGQAGFKDRMLFGTDFPITHYWDCRKVKTEKIQVPTAEELDASYKKLLTNYPHAISALIE